MYAAAIAYGVFVLLIYALYVRQFGMPISAGLFIFLLLGILLFAIVVSFTRATWLSLIVALGAWLLTRFRVRFYWIVLAFLTVGTVAFLKQNDIQFALEANKQGSSDELEGHVKSVSNISTDPSNLERINRWKCAARMVSERPIFGFGPGTYVFQYGPFQKSSELTIISTHSGDLGDAHSEYFSAMSETGFLGMFFWLGIVFATLSTAFNIIYTTQSLKIRLTTYMVFLGLVAYHAHAVLNNYSQYDKLAVPLWAFTAIIVALDIRNKRLIRAQKSPTA
jgi:O-antigen ligase